MSKVRNEKPSGVDKRVSKNLAGSGTTIGGRSKGGGVIKDDHSSSVSTRLREAVLFQAAKGSFSFQRSLSPF